MKFIKLDFEPRKRHLRSWRRRQLRNALLKALKASGKALGEAAMFEIRVRVSGFRSLMDRFDEIPSSAAKAEEGNKANVAAPSADSEGK